MTQAIENEPVDLLILVIPQNIEETSTFASAGPCLRARRDGRVNLGKYNLNLAKINTEPIFHYTYFSTFAHELTHVLGLSKGGFKLFVDPQTGKNMPAQLETMELQREGEEGKKETFYLMTTKAVVDFARQYFGCPTLKGLPLENDHTEEGSGYSSHWEKLFLPNEYMNPSVENPGILTEFTFSFLRGTGWYKTKLNAAQYYDWGKGLGCDYFNICPKTQEVTHCSDEEMNQAVCSPDYTAKVDIILSSQFVTRIAYLHLVAE